MKQCGLALLLIIFAAQAYGASLLPSRPTPSEMALLPDYCKIKFNYDAHAPEFRVWLDRLGAIYYSMHHYCEGLNFINRYRYQAGDKHRDYYLSRAVPAIKGFANEMPPNYPMASDVYLNLGIAYKLTGNDASASKYFSRSLDRDPRQVWAYINLVELYKKAGKKDEALKLVSSGLQHIPKNESLQRIYLDLGGREPFPAPLQPSASSMQDNNAAGTGVKSKPTVERTNAETSMPKGEAGSANGEANQSKIGTPTNPYCRFCPPE